MNLEPDRAQIETFVDALFRYASTGNYFSSRSFHEAAVTPFRISAVKLNGDLSVVTNKAFKDARLAAVARKRIVFCPPIATFSNAKHAREVDLVEGLALSVECDQHAQEARAKLEELLGPATVVVASGGEWTNPESGEVSAKLHVHYRLRTPARGKDGLAKLKQARGLATAIVGGDATNKPVVHPIRWPGSWHRKKEPPRLCTIVAKTENEIDLDTAHAALLKAAPAGAKTKTDGKGKGSEGSGWGDLIGEVLRAESFHEPLNRLALKMVYAGMSNGAAVNMLRGLMEQAAGPRDQRWKVRYDDIPRAVSTARETQAAAAEQEQASAEEQGAEGVSLANFYAYMPAHSYLFALSREMWPAGSVNARIPAVVVGKNEKGEAITVSASVWLDRNRPVEMLTWAPGLPMVISDRLISEGGWIERKGVSCFNLYRGPTIELGDASKAAPWLDLVRRVFRREGDFPRVVQWFAHRVQRPWEKVNHALVMGSLHQGIGKDTILEAVKRAIGPWNFKEVMPGHLFEPFNPFVRSVLLRINEAKDMGEVSRYELYEHLKLYLAAPPDVLPCNEKHIRQHYVLNCMGVVITTNHLSDGVFLPPEDRRHYVAWSDAKPQDFAEGYWNDFYTWLNNGGDRDVAAWLNAVDLSGFDPTSTLAAPVRRASCRT
jgi:hypothetical protein